MNVKSNFKGFFGTKAAMICGMLIAIIAVFFIASSFTKPQRHDLFVKQVNLTIREIGHHLLLQAGDSTSRVLPVIETAPGVFRLTFENPLSFKSDSLISLTQRLLAKTNLSDYTVTVHECYNPTIVFGFYISKPTDTTAQACRGRTQPEGCYTIEIAFANFDNTTADYTAPSIITSGFLLLLVVVVVARRNRTTVSVVKADDQNPVADTTHESLPQLGGFVFDIKNQKLHFGEETILLTDKESKVLQLLNQNFGELTTREELIQQIWANEGVITGRSLDMFISKLRKKLSTDPQLRITNVHGKGYKLESVES